MKNFLFREKPALFLMYLLKEYTDEPKTRAWLSYKIKCTYGHITEIIKKYINAGLVAEEKNGRIKILSLTKKGYIISQKLNLIWNMLGGEGK